MYTRKHKIVSEQRTHHFQKCYIVEWKADERIKGFSILPLYYAKHLLTVAMNLPASTLNFFRMERSSDVGKH